MSSVSYSVNNKEIMPSDLDKIQITKKEYIDYMDSLKNEIMKIYCNENVTKMNNAGWQNLVFVVKWVVKYIHSMLATHLY